MKLIIFILIMMTLINCGKLYDDAVKAMEKNNNHKFDNFVKKVVKTAIFMQFPILSPFIEIMDENL